MLYRMSLLTLALSLSLSFSCLAQSKNGFDLSEALIPAGEILSGGPAKDGIPAINKPRYITPEQATWLDAKDRVIGLVINNQAHAYPIKILNWHEVVNASFDKQNIVISYCPLCGTGMVFSAKAGEKNLNFGVSGLLYQSDVLLYDRETQSLWSQLMSQAISGPLKGHKLTLLPSSHTSYAQWLKHHPETKILDINTGHQRDYNRDPYGDYQQSLNIYFPVNNTAPRHYHPKDEILGISYKGQHLAIPFRELAKTGKKTIDYPWQNKNWKIHWTAEAHEARLEDSNGQTYPGTRAYWFAWYTFHPETSVYKSDQ